MRLAYWFSELKTVFSSARFWKPRRLRKRLRVYVVPCQLELLETRILLSRDSGLGPELRINSTTDGGAVPFFHGGLYPVSGSQFAVKLDSDANGNFVAVWQGPNRDGRGTFDVFLQPFDINGRPVGSEVVVNAEWHGQQTNPDVAVAPDGRIIVVYEHTNDDQAGGQFNSLTSISAQLLNRDGTPIGEPIQVASTPARSWAPGVGVTRDGSFVVTWTNQSADGSSAAMLARRFDSSGRALSDEFRVNTTPLNSQVLQVSNSMAMNDAGAFVVVWSNFGPDGSDQGVFGQRFNALGERVGGEFRVNTTTYDAQLGPRVAMDSLGRFMVTWTSRLQDGSGWGVYAQRFAADGTPAGPEFLVTNTTQGEQGVSDITVDGDGRYIITWNSDHGSDLDVYTRLFAADGTPLGDEVRANQTTTSTQFLPAVAFGKDGRYFVAWTSLDQDDAGYGVYGRLAGVIEAIPTLPNFVKVSVDDSGNLTLNETGSVTNHLTVTRNATTNEFVVASTFNELSTDGLTARNNIHVAAASVTGGLIAHLGLGHDRLDFSRIALSATVSGDAGNDTILGGAGNDSIDGREGNDSLIGNNGNDRLDGGDGDDFVDGRDGDDSVGGGIGYDTVRGGSGRDLQSESTNAARINVSASTITGLGSVNRTTERINSDIEGIQLVGGDREQFFEATASNRPVTLLGGAGSDTLKGGRDDDQLFGESGRDELDGGLGNDTLSGGDDRDNVLGGDGLDLLIGGDANDTLDGGSGNDTLRGEAGMDLLRGAAGNDSLDGGDDADTLLGEAGNDTLLGGAGADSLDGSIGNDRLAGGLGNDFLEGGNGNDSLRGGEGSDFLAGDAGNDVVIGELGTDILTGGLGRDTLTGGIGSGIADAGDNVEANDRRDVTDEMSSLTDDWRVDTSLTLEDMGQRLSRQTMTGATIIVHGFQLTEDGDALLPLARAIRDRADLAANGGVLTKRLGSSDRDSDGQSAWLLDDDVVNVGPNRDEQRLDVRFDSVQSVIPSSSEQGLSGHVVLLFDWGKESNNLSSGWTEAEGDALFSQLIALGLVHPEQHTSVPLHFIGHSFGAAIVSEAVERLASYQVPVDQVTYLDPHDFDQGLLFDGAQAQSVLGKPTGYGATVWDNVAFADAYFQTRGENGGLAPDAIVPLGRPIPGAWNFFLNNSDTPTTLATATVLPNNGNTEYGSFDAAGDHSFVWNTFYLASVAVRPLRRTSQTGSTVEHLSEDRNGNNRLDLGEDLDGDGRLTKTFPAPKTDFQFTSIANAEGTMGGYGLSRVAGGSSVRQETTFAPNFFAVGQDPQQPQQTPDWNSLSISNGDFAHAGAFPDQQPDDIPGWNQHSTPIGNDEGSARDGFLQLGVDAAYRTHNRQYVPTTAASVEFQFQRMLITTIPQLSDELEVRLGNNVLGRVRLDAKDTAFGSKSFSIPNELLGTIQTLTFAIASGDRPVRSEVRIDDMLFR